jgi:hypothetical protein
LLDVLLELLEETQAKTLLEVHAQIGDEEDLQQFVDGLEGGRRESCGYLEQVSSDFLSELVVLHSSESFHHPVQQQLLFDSDTVDDGVQLVLLELWVIHFLHQNTHQLQYALQLVVIAWGVGANECLKCLVVGQERDPSVADFSGDRAEVGGSACFLGWLQEEAHHKAMDVVINKGHSLLQLFGLPLSFPEGFKEVQGLPQDK